MLLAPAAIAATAACGWARERDRSSFLRSAAERIGSATFAIYLSHTFVIGPAAKFAAAHAPGLPAWAFIPVIFVLGTAFGVAVHQLAERPLIAGWRRLFGPRRAAGARERQVPRLYCALLLALGLAPSQADATVPSQRLDLLERNPRGTTRLSDFVERQEALADALMASASRKLTQVLRGLAQTDMINAQHGRGEQSSVPMPPKDREPASKTMPLKPEAAERERQTTQVLDLILADVTDTTPPDFRDGFADELRMLVGTKRDLFPWRFENVMAADLKQTPRGDVLAVDNGRAVERIDLSRPPSIAGLPIITKTLV